ncbi:MAG: SIR2 family NAD-dependent protein deacylase [Acidimicrobiales bacterium]
MPGTQQGRDEVVARAAALVAAAQRVVVLTGAGISTDSGIPDFRGPNGVWTRNPAAEKQATIQNYVADVEVRKAAWQNRLHSTYWSAQPNVGHHALASFATTGRLLALITQNVDGLHHAAGTDPAKIIEIHGSVREVVCLSCEERAPMERALARVEAGEEDPACRTCGGILKSATISFGQGLVAQDLQRADQVARQCDLMVAIGTTLAVYPIAEVVPIAARNRAQVIIINAEPTAMDSLADVVIQASIADVLPAVLGVAPPL